MGVTLTIDGASPLPLTVVTYPSLLLLPPPSSLPPPLTLDGRHSRTLLYGLPASRGIARSLAELSSSLAAHPSSLAELSPSLAERPSSLTERPSSLAELSPSLAELPRPKTTEDWREGGKGGVAVLAKREGETRSPGEKEWRSPGEMKSKRGEKESLSPGEGESRSLDQVLRPRRPGWGLHSSGLSDEGGI
ncbi:hypothetical protein K523DRAFT_354946 [Schizophyllum commune Tattone D]|nr:hypothetical protein K523DRAFT_354946 [Schizophyllum commune Tattone D]